MLRLRVVTAIALLAVLLPALFAAQALPFAVVTLGLVAAAGWEWGRLNAAGAGLSWAFGIGLALIGWVAMAGQWPAALPVAFWAAVALLWVVAGAFALHRGPNGWPKLPPSFRWGLGTLLLFVAWLALARSRGIGINFVLSVLALVWAADIAAYAGGRAFGRRKLAPTISPGKTWEGAITGAVAVLLLAALWRWVDERGGTDSQSLYTRLAQAWGTIGSTLALLALTAMSVAGDLFESLVKRAAGAKDSSRLLPGHGGVLDRIDALLPVFPCALALAAWPKT